MFYQCRIVYRITTMPHKLDNINNCLRKQLINQTNAHARLNLQLCGPEVKEPSRPSRRAYYQLPSWVKMPATSLPHDGTGCRQIGTLACCLYGGWPQEGHSCCLLQKAAAEPRWRNRVKATPWHCWLQNVREKKKRERHCRTRRRGCSPLPHDQAARYTKSDRLSNTLIPSRSQPSVGEGRSHRRGSAGPVVTGSSLGSTSEDAWLTEDLA